MRISEISFRNINKNFLVLYNMGEKFDMYAKVFPSMPGDNALLLYGYIDHSAGISFEVLCCGKRNDDGSVILRKPQDTISMKIRYDGIDGELDYFEYSVQLSKYQSKVDMIDEGYYNNKILEQIRKDRLFDARRHEMFPDDIAVTFFKPGVQVEVIWVRTEKIEKGKIVGTLLESPYSDEYGVQGGDDICLVPVSVKDNGIIPVAEFSWIYN